MDEWLKLDEVARELNATEKKLFSVVVSGDIKLTWKPGDFIHVYSVDISTGEFRYFDDNNPYPGDEPIDSLRDGYFEIDLNLCSNWATSLNDIRLGYKGYGHTFAPYGPMVVKEVGAESYIWSVTPPPELDKNEEIDFPTMQTLGVFKKELDRYNKQLKRLKDFPNTNITEQRIKAYKNLLDDTDQWHRLKDKRDGKAGFKNEVYAALEYIKADDGSYLFAKKGQSKPDKKNMKGSWESFLKKHI